MYERGDIIERDGKRFLIMNKIIGSEKSYKVVKWWIGGGDTTIIMIDDSCKKICNTFVTKDFGKED